MKRIIFFLSLLLINTISFAQGDGSGRVRALRLEYVKSKLNLNEEQSKKFVPVYTNYMNERAALRSIYKSQFSGDKSTPMGKLQANQFVDDNIEYKEKDLALSKKYKDELLKCITAQQLAILYQSEREFKSMLLQKLKSGKMPY
jgi:hypothetical protein